MKQLDFTENMDGFDEGLYVKVYSDGEVLVKIFFTGQEDLVPFQDAADSWLSRDDAEKLRDALNEVLGGQE